MSVVGKYRRLQVLSTMAGGYNSPSTKSLQDSPFIALQML